MYSMETIETDLSVTFHYSHEEEERSIAVMTVYLHPVDSICYVDGFKISRILDQFHGGASENVITDEEAMITFIAAISTPEQFTESILRALSEKLIEIEQPKVVFMTPEA
jgi:hypothetical protein